MKLFEEICVVTDDFWYDINAGYIKPSDFTDDPETEARIREAIDILTDCEALCEFH